MVTLENLDSRLKRLENLHLYGGAFLALGLLAYIIFKK